MRVRFFRVLFLALLATHQLSVHAEESTEYLYDTSASMTESSKSLSSGDYGCDLEYDTCDSCIDPWTFTFTQTADFGTNLALPISLTPANTVIAPLGNLANRGILDLNLANALGILDDLNLTGVATPNVPAVPVFEDDFQFQTNAGLVRRQQVGDDGTFTTGYTFYQSLHPDVDEVDLSSHTASAQYAHRLSEEVVGAVDYNYSYYFLSDSTFVTQNRAGASLLFRRSELWDWQIRGDYSDANFRRSSFLNSDNYSAKFEGIRYLYDDRREYLTFGYAAGYSDAEFRGFSYQVNNFYVGGRWLYGADLRNTLSATASYGIYDFIGTDVLEPGIFRRDDILTLNLTLSRQISDDWTGFFAYTYLDSDSNIARQLYNSDLFSLGLTYSR